ncbi:S1 RNA-binding domain-containing protein [Kitasatospora arboriphila]|uniref:S1 motif domain-containing protein n=1 Tax=Kitasatospora arboriphila TaxID=258052 RepID=A0ABP4ETA1_9ACTN
MALQVYRLTPYEPVTEARYDDCSPDAYRTRAQTAAALSDAAAGFVREAGAERLVIGSPMVKGFFSFSTRGSGGPDGPAGVFPGDPTGFHDGATLPAAAGLTLLRAVLQREGAWCRLRAGRRFFLHPGHRDDLFVGFDGGEGPLRAALTGARSLGLFAEKVGRSPYDPALDETDVRPPADGVFWTAVHCLVAERGAVLLEEEYAAHGRRWHRLATEAAVTAVRRRLVPRARLAVWPDLTEDIEAVRAEIRAGRHPHLLVRQEADGTFPAERVAEPWMGRADGPHPAVPTGPGRRAGLVPLQPAHRRPLLAAVLPDADGIVRARWRTDPTPATGRRALLAGLRIGDVVTGTVASDLDDVGVHVDLDHPSGRSVGFLRIPEMSWTRFDSLDEVAPPGRRIRAQVLDIDWAWERVGLSVKALQPDPWRLFADRLRHGAELPGTVVRLVPFGTFVRVAPGVEGLVHGPWSDGPAPVVGDPVRVTVLAVDRPRRRITLGLPADACDYG